jgi:hypothetical protein
LNRLIKLTIHASFPLPAQRKSDVGIKMIAGRYKHNRLATFLMSHKCWEVHLFNFAVAAPLLITLASSFLIFVMTFHWVNQLGWTEPSIKAIFTIHATVTLISTAGFAALAMKVGLRRNARGRLAVVPSHPQSGRHWVADVLSPGVVSLGVNLK